jgi:uncharacterized protein YkwD
MKYIITLSLLFSLFVCKSQKIDYNNFDKKLFEKILFNKLNNLRKSINVDTLVWSNVLYKEVTAKQVSIVTKENRLYHPDLSKMWKDSTRVRNLISDESEKKFGVKTRQSTYHGPSMWITENIYRGYNIDVTYEELANIVISAFDKSPGHRINQRGICEYLNTPGFASCSVGIVPNTKIIYVGFNFVTIFRE